MTPTFKPYFQVVDNQQGVKKTKSFGLTYLKENAIQHFNQGIQLYDECFHLFVGFNTHHSQSFREAVIEIKTYRDKGINVYEEEMGRIRQDLHAAAIISAYKVRQYELAKESNWKTWENQLRATVEKLALEKMQLIAHLVQQKLIAAQEQTESQKSELTENMTKVENIIAQLDKNIVKLENDIKELPLLKSKWCQHPQFFLYSNEALLFASDILADLEVHVQAAMEEYQASKNQLPTKPGKKAITLNSPALQQEFADKQIPTGNYRLQYADFLRDFNKRIQQEKVKLCDVMLDRLMLGCENGDMLNQDMAYACEQALSAKGIKPFNVPLTTPRYETSAHTVAGFARHIAAHGTKQQQIRFSGLTLFQDKASLPLKVIHASSSSFLIPKALSNLVPSQPSRFPSLFTGYQRRHEFFQQHSDLLVECALLNQRLFILNDRHDVELLNTHWNTLSHTQASLMLAYQNAIKQHAPAKNGLWASLFRQKTATFFTMWEAQLTEQLITVLDKQIDLIRQALPSVNQDVQPLEPLMENYIFSFEITMLLKSKLAAIETALQDSQRQILQAHSKIPLALSQLQEKLNQTKSQLNDYFDQDQITFDKKADYKDMSRQLALLVENKETATDVYQAIANYAERLQATDSNKAAQFIATHQIIFNKLKSELMQLMGKVVNQGITTIQASELNRIQNLYNVLNEFDLLTANPKWINLCNKVATLYHKQRLEIAKSHETELFEKILEDVSDTAPEVAEIMEDLQTHMVQENKTAPWQSTYQHLDTQLEALSNKTDEPILTPTEQCHQRTQANLDEFNQALTEWQQQKQMHQDRLAAVVKFRQEDDAVCNEILRHLAQSKLPDADGISGEAETEYSADEVMPGHERQRNILSV